MKDKELTVIADYSACTHCINMGSTSSNGEIDYCKLRNEGESLPTRLDEGTWLNGCPQFEWNGMPVNKAVMDKIMTDPAYEANQLRSLPQDEPGTTTPMAFWTIASGNGSWQSWGESFDRQRFEQAFPNEPRIVLPLTPIQNPSE